MHDQSSDVLWKAYHEAGHAVAAHAHGGTVQCVSILANEHYQGVCEFSFNRVFQTHSHNPAINKLISLIVISLAGPAAQARFAPESCEPEQALADHQHALESLACLAALKGFSAYDLAYYEDLADQFVHAEENWAAIEALANALGRRNRLSGAQASQIIDRVWQELCQ